MSDIDYGAVLADLRQRRDDLEAAIRAIQQLTGLAAGPMPSPYGGNGEVQPDSFFNMTILEAVKKFLAMRKRSQKVAAIAKALQAGGLINESANFTATVATTLRRAQGANGGIVQVKKDKTWGLAEWYPKSAKSARTDSKAEGDKSEADEEDTPALGFGEDGEAILAFPAANASGQPS